MRGDGRGVTSAMAFNIGDDKAEFGAEPKLELLPTLLAKMFLTLGVLANVVVDDLDGILVDSFELLAVLLVLAAVII